MGTCPAWKQAQCVCVYVRAWCPGGWGSLGMLLVVREAALLGNVLICGVFLKVLC